MTVPRAAHVVSFVFMGLLLAGAAALCIGFAVAQADPRPVVGADMSAVLLIFAAILLVPLLVALLLWSAGYALRRRFPRSALALVVASAVVGGLAVLSVLPMLVPVG